MIKKLFLFLCIALLLCNGCKFFKKSSSKVVDTLTADTAQAEIIDSAAYYGTMPDAGKENLPASPQKSSSVQGKYYMIVGCFTMPGNADKYAEKIRGMGYETQIIPGRDNFQMVAAKSYDNYRTSVNEIDKFRNEVTPNAWVYLQH